MDPNLKESLPVGFISPDRTKKLEVTLALVKEELETLCRYNSPCGCGVCSHRPREFCRWGQLLDLIDKVI